jgi:nicotinamidase-related amidase
MSMAVTTLDPNTALIVVDLQKGIVAYPTAHSINDVVSRGRSLADTFRARNLPVALVNVAGSAPGRTEIPRKNQSFLAGWTDLIPELNQKPDDIVVTKRTWGAFASTDLEDQLLRGASHRS